MEITENTRLNDIIHQSQGLSKVFKKYKLHCLTCRGVIDETLGHIATNNGLDVKELLEDVKKAVETHG
jgi:hybrid cluster-associated redox disulfide protein